jgi:hypothetical protein
MNNIIPQTSLFLGIIPALIMLYIGLKGYEGYFKDKIIFLTFIVGIIIGFIAAVIELLTAAIWILAIVLFPIIEQLFKTIILNIGRFQEKQETTIYGLSLGLGFGSVFTPAALIMGNFQSEDLTLIILVMIGTLGIILFQGAAGVLIGYGIYASKLAKYLTFTILLQLPITTLFFVTSWLNIEYLQISIVVYGIVIYWYAIKKIMPRILTGTQRRKRTQKEIIK